MGILSRVKGGLQDNVILFTPTSILTPLGASNRPVTKFYTKSPDTIYSYPIQ